jgi:hypothetical protein
MSGKAILGTHYTLSGPRGQATIPAGTSSVNVTLTPLTANLTSGKNMAVKMTLQRGSGYKLSSAKKASITIVSPPASSPTPRPTATPIATPAPTPDPRNVALAFNGGVATASSTLNTNFPVSGINNGDRKGLAWGAGGGWNDGTSDVYPDWVQIDFSSSKTINEIDVFTTQDNYAAPITPTLSTVFSLYGITGFDVQYWQY